MADDLGNWLFVPNSLIGQVGQTMAGIGRGFQYTIGDPLSGNTFQQAQPMGQGEFNAVLDYAKNIEGFGDYQLEQLKQYGRGRSRGYVEDLIDKMKRQVQSDRQAYDPAISAAESSVNRASGEATRLGGLLTVPGAIRNDAEYGTALAAAENSINAEVNDVMRQTAASTAYSGVRGGNMAKKILETRLEGGSRRASAQAGLKSDIASRKVSYQEYADQQQKYLDSLRIQRLGGLPSMNAQEEGVGPMLSGQYASRALSQSMLANIIGVGEHAMDTGANMMTSMMDMMKKG